VLIARPGKLADAPQALWLRENAAGVGLREMEVEPLSYHESKEVLRSLIPTDEPQLGVAEQRALLRAAAGFPMVLELLVQEWKVSGGKSLTLALDAMTSELATVGSTKLSYSNIMSGISTSLDTTTRNILNLASILGNRLNDLSLYAVVDLTAGQTTTGLAELVNRRVLRDAPQGLEFVNELIRASSYLAVPPSLRRVLHGKIADRFIQEQLHGDSGLGLSIAWHCMRAGRTHEASNYLLCGARESLQKGAVHEAERALATALTHLDTVQKPDATLLLVEVLQEQGRWQESLELLCGLNQSQNGPLVRVLSVMAECKSMFMSPEQLRIRLDQLRDVMENCLHIGIRVRAADVASILISQLRDPGTAKELLASIDQIPIAPLEMDDLASFANSRAKMVYTASERPPGLRQVVEVAAQLRAKGHVNSRLGNLHVGIGAVACCEGRYQDAKTEFLVAHDLFANLGNESSRAHQAAQMALCCVRLGQYHEAINWSLSASPSCEVPFLGYMECQIALSSGASYALIGNPVEAMGAISKLDSRLSQNAPSWIKQAWGLHKADILCLCGRLPEALLVAKDAVGPDQGTLYSAFFAGPFARWTALIAARTEGEKEVRARLNAMVDQLTIYDAIDQVEILCARKLLSRVPGMLNDELQVLISAKLALLPSAIVFQLTNLRILLSSNGGITPDFT
jgi:hypothetical protein